MTTIINGSSPSITFSDATTQASAGVVLQVVQATTTTAFSTSSNSYVTTGFSASITPKFSTSKILVNFNGRIYVNTTGNEGSISIYRGGSSIWGGNSVFNSAGGIAAQQSINYLDNPSTTSSTTYTLYIKTAGGAVILMPNGASDGIGTITLMEIAQ
jgi:hypothetical protein